MGKYRTTRGEDHPTPPKLRRRRRRRRRFIAGFVVAALLGAGFLIRFERSVPAKGYVTTEVYAEVRPPMSGPVAEIRFRTGDKVEAGDVLVRLDSEEQAAQLAAARSRLSRAEAQLVRRETEWAEKRRMLRDEITIAEMKLANERAHLERMKDLLARGLAAESQLQDQQLEVQLAAARLESLRSHDDSIYDRERTVLERELEALNRSVEEAAARVRAREVRAPVAGRVLRYEFEEGETVRPEHVLYEIFGGERMLLKLHIGERHSARVAPGRKYRAVVASYSGLPRVYFRGEVERLRNVIQAEQTRAYRVAYCSFDPGLRDVNPGTTAEARIYVGRACLWSALLGWR